jgi:hypothetical protein
LDAENWLPSDSLSYKFLQKSGFQKLAGCCGPELVLADECSPRAGWEEICPDTSSWKFFRWAKRQILRECSVPISVSLEIQSERAK